MAELLLVARRYYKATLNVMAKHSLDTHVLILNQNLFTRLCIGISLGFIMKEHKLKTTVSFLASGYL